MLPSAIVVIALPSGSFPWVTVITVATAKLVIELGLGDGRISTRSPALTAEDVPSSTIDPLEPGGRRARGRRGTDARGALDGVGIRLPQGWRDSHGRSQLENLRLLTRAGLALDLEHRRGG